MKNFSILEWFIIAAIMLIIVSIWIPFLLLDKKWERFRVEHDCRITAERDRTGYAAAQTVWLCDDGVMYWKNRY